MVAAEMMLLCAVATPSLARTASILQPHVSCVSSGLISALSEVIRDLYINQITGSHPASADSVVFQG